MQIGIVPVSNEAAGGVYQYSETMLTALYHLESEHDFLIFSEDARRLGYLGDSKEHWRVVPMEPFSLKRLFKKYGKRLLGPHRYPEFVEKVRPLPRRRLGIEEQLEELEEPAEPEPFDPDVVNYNPDQGRWFANKGAEFMLYPTTTSVSFESGVPYVMAVHDLQHKLQPEFPEVSADGEAERREYIFRNGVRYAALILADSETGKEDILNCYGDFITEDRIKVLPFLPPPYLEAEPTPEDIVRVREKYNLPEKYLFYPAQFWPHKNHARVVEALSVLRGEYGIRATILFCGSASGPIRRQRKEEVLAAATETGVSDQVVVTGYLPNEDMAALYSGAVALVFPTFFGPTNIPVLEAWSLRCPVLSSDIRGIREQVGEAGVLVNPRSAEDIAEGIRKIWVDRDLRARLITRGLEKISAYTLADFSSRLIAALEEAGKRIDSLEAS